MKSYGILLFLFFVTISCQHNKGIPAANTLLFYNEEGLQRAKQAIAENDVYYTSALKTVTQKADEYLEVPADPVVNKSVLPMSGNPNDYLSLAPYWWPDPKVENGLPWIRKDGEVNPMTRGKNTDKQRLRQLLEVLNHLNMTFYYTDEVIYANKIIALIETWFVNEKTRMNPNVNFGQGIPGINDGRPYGIIEWRGMIENLITSLQLLAQKDLLNDTLKTATQTWLTQYLDWLLHSELGQLAGATENNHANWYDYQVIGIAIYLGRTDVAKKWANAAKVNRIASQIEVDGSQPHELGRTKSLSYSVMNLKAMVLVANMAQKVEVDLLNFTDEEGRSLLKAVDFLTPYAKKEKAWAYAQISKGGWRQTVDQSVLPLFSMISGIYGRPIFEDKELMQQQLGALDRLKYPPLLYE